MQEIFAIQIETFCNDVQSTSFSIGFTSAGLINDKLLLWNIKLQHSSCLLGSVAQLEQIFQLLPYGGHPVLTSAAVQEDACSYMHFTEVPSFSLPDAPASTTAQHVKKKRGRPANSGVSQKLPNKTSAFHVKRWEMLANKIVGNDKFHIKSSKTFSCCKWQWHERE